MFVAEQINIISPKRDKSQQKGWEGFFPYYAGYTENFAAAVLDSLKLDSKATVFDPWNGSGTTTYVAATKGLNVIGQDINPVMVIVARARMLQFSEADSLEPLALEIIRGAKYSRFEKSDDPLNRWFVLDATKTIRGIDKSIQKRLVGSLTKNDRCVNLEKISSLAATYYVALFSVCRNLTKIFRPTNPTWLKVPKSEDERVVASASDIEGMFIKQIKEMSEALLEKEKKINNYQSQAVIKLADSASADLHNNCADLVLTSPPYCTRIDYAAATRVELAVLHDLLAVDMIELSRRMIGSTRVPLDSIEVVKSWGSECEILMGKIRNHHSKASKGYYYTTHADYFSKMFKSLGAIKTALKPSGLAILVVQDSYYKEIHNDLPKIISEMGSNNGMKVVRKDDFFSKRSMSGINPHVKASRGSTGATEAVICFAHSP